MRTETAIAVVVLLMLGGCAAAPRSSVSTERAPVGQAELQVGGTWSGALDDRGRGVVQMTVDAGVVGSSFDAQLTFADRAGQRSGTGRAELTPNGHLVITIGEEASVEAHISDPAILDYCFVVYGFQPVYSCGRLVRDSTPGGG